MKRHGWVFIADGARRAARRIVFICSPASSFENTEFIEREALCQRAFTVELALRVAECDHHQAAFAAAHLLRRLHAAQIAGSKPLFAVI